MKKTILVCSECKGKNIDVRAWVDANTNIYASDIGNDDINDNWCNDCEDHVKFDTIEKEILN